MLILRGRAHSLADTPMTQINTPYPATAYLTGFLRERGYDAVQADPAIQLLLNCSVVRTPRNGRHRSSALRESSVARATAFGAEFSGAVTEVSRHRR